jgi:hypothetical protein
MNTFADGNLSENLLYEKSLSSSDWKACAKQAQGRAIRSPLRAHIVVVGDACPFDLDQGANHIHAGSVKRRQ